MPIEHIHPANGYRATIHDLERDGSKRIGPGTGWDLNREFELNLIEVDTSAPNVVNVVAIGHYNGENFGLTLSKQDARNLAEALLTAAKDLDDREIARLRSCRPAPQPAFYGVPDEVELPVPQPEVA